MSGATDGELAGSEVFPEHAPQDQHSGERRNSFRVRVAAQAGVFHNGQLSGQYKVRDLSSGGCLLSGVLTQHPPGCHVEVMLHLPQHNSLGVTARVRRVFGDSMALSFEHATPRAEGCIQDLVLQAFATLRAHGDNFVALIIDPCPTTRSAFMQQLRALGQPVIGVATALDAVQLLMEQAERVDCAFIQSPSSQVPSFELLEFLAQQHPHIRRVSLHAAPDTDYAPAVDMRSALHSPDSHPDPNASISACASEAPPLHLLHSMLALPSSDRDILHLLSRVRGLVREAPLA